METSIKTIKDDKYTFTISKSIMRYGGNIISHTYKIGGEYSDCVNISYTYMNNKPVSTKMPHLLYEPECSVGVRLEKGGGTITMIKAAMRLAHTDVPEIDDFQFDDMSHIDCIEKNTSKAPPRKPIRPVNLACFSIAYYGKTWYEMKFNATMMDTERYAKYRKSVSFLTDSSQMLPFIQFLQIIKPPAEHISDLEKWYTTSKTYREFFEAIPKDRRCDILYFWIETFIKHYLEGVYTEKGWKINIKTMDVQHHSGGTRKRSKRGGSSEPMYSLFEYRKIHNL
jgi:hypothetical protein